MIEITLKRNKDINEYQRMYTRQHDQMFVRCEILAAVWLRSEVFSDATLWHWASGCRHTASSSIWGVRCSAIRRCGTGPVGADTLPHLQAEEWGVQRCDAVALGQWVQTHCLIFNLRSEVFSDATLWHWASGCRQTHCLQRCDAVTLGQWVQTDTLPSAMRRCDTGPVGADRHTAFIFKLRCEVFSDSTLWHWASGCRQTHCLQRCDAVTLGQWVRTETLPHLQESSSSRTPTNILLGFTDYENEGTTFVRNVGNYSPNDAASHRRRSESSRRMLTRQWLRTVP
jgi:endogenous inhibitor of DNA gyrase (YacG/DUF329 family)